MSINTLLVDDILYSILKQADNYHCFITCKKWYNLMLQKSKVCSHCNKITHMYDTQLWFNITNYTFNNKNLYCHQFYSSTEIFMTYKKILKNGCFQFINMRKCLSICLEAVNINGFSLQYIPVQLQTENLCLQAITNDYRAFQYVYDQTEKICIHAIRKNVNAATYLTYQTEKICLEIVKKDGIYLEYIDNKTEAICIEAVKNNYKAFKYVPDIYKTENVCLEVVKNNHNALHLIPSNYRTEDVYMEVVKHKADILSLIPNKHLTEKIYMQAIKYNSDALRYIKYPNINMCLKSMEDKYENYKYIRDMTLQVEARKIYMLNMK
jgi:hypothetical protein